MKKLILILAILFAPSISAQDINPKAILEELISKYASFVTVHEEKTVEYQTVVTYNDGRKSNVLFINSHVPFDFVMPEFGIEYYAPEIEPLRLIDGVMWLGSKKSRTTNVSSFEVISEKWFNSDEYVEPVKVPTILEFVNHPSVTVQELDNISYVRASSAEIIVATRPLTLEQLDDISWVGTNTLKNLTEYAKTWVNPDTKETPVLDPCQTSIITEWNIDDVWYYGQPKVEVNAGSYFVISGLPNTTNFTIIKPDGTIVDDDYKINSISKNDAGVYIIRSNEGCEKPLEVIIN